MRIGTKGLTMAWTGLFTVLLLARGVAADARTDFLLDMLENGGNYRLKVQAATTLGKIRCKEAVPALTAALRDRDELVVIAVATALGQIGDPSVIGAMEKALATTPSGAAASQLKATLRVLKALVPDATPEDDSGATPRFLVRIDAMGNSSGVADGELTARMRTLVDQMVRKQAGALVQETAASAAEVKTRLKRGKLEGYILSGALLRMEQVSGQLVVKISLNVFTNPDYNLLMMPTMEGAVPLPESPSSKEAERETQDRALKAVVEGLVDSVFKALRRRDGE
ncbi:MAG: HEAT repeat domain-containing protein [Deltaproteobacteria bacterium]|nr:HEAT repeat domain-containing protein [Deltaproteobacteria bacterium]